MALEMSQRYEGTREDITSKENGLWLSSPFARQWVIWPEVAGNWKKISIDMKNS